MYFSKIPNIYYDFVINGVHQMKVLKDVTVNVRFIADLLSNITVYDEYDILDGETPEIIATKVYGNPQYHWIIMLANDRYDYREDFPMDYTTLHKYVIKKYGAGNEYAHHHWISSHIGIEGHHYIVDEFFPTKTSVSNFQYEETENEKKRRIKLISKPMLDVVLKQYSKMFE